MIAEADVLEQWLLVELCIWVYITFSIDGGAIKWVLFLGY